MDTAALLGEISDAIDAGRDVVATEKLEALLAYDPHNAAARWQMGRFFGRKEAYNQASVLFEQAVTIDPRLSSVEFSVRGKPIALRDIAGSSMPAKLLREFADGMYGLMARTFEPGDIIVDVGAHIGIVSIVLAKLHPYARVIAYEPSASNFAMLAANIADNRVLNVEPVREAIAGTPGTMDLMWSPADSTGATATIDESARIAREHSGWQRESVTCVTLDQAFARHGIERCAFLKLDCEGAEWDICRTSAALERVTTMALELHAPASRMAEGIQPIVGDFTALIRNRPRWPETVIASTLWMKDA